MEARFKDHFSAHARDYATHRPRYPRELFEWLAATAPARDAAWDAGTGNGQAAIDLAAFFARVTASDPSAAQIEAAPSHPGISFIVAPAEDSGLPSESCDLITVAQALHWFDIPRFMHEAERVLKSRGVLAVWCYGLFTVDDEVAVAFSRFHQLVEPYWPSERALIDSGYSEIEIPFAPLEHPPFEMSREWSAAETVGYLLTWSATRRYLSESDRGPLEQAVADIERSWGAGRRAVRWPLHLRAGRKS